MDFVASPNSAQKHSTTLNIANIRMSMICVTAVPQTSVGDKGLSKEVVHLAAGMLAAGYQGVVATVWSIKDEYTPQIAEAFYDFFVGRNARQR